MCSKRANLIFSSLSVALLLLGAAFSLQAQQPVPFSTLAGYAGEGSADGSGSAARFSLPAGVTADATGNLYVADSANNTIRKISPSGSVTTLAGLAGVSGTNDGTGNSARFFQPVGIAVDGAGNVYVADSGNNTIRKITTNGVVSTLAGLAGVSGTNDGFGTNALFNQPQGLALDTTSIIYVADYGNDTIRTITPSGSVSTLAGQPGNFGSSNGPVGTALFYEPQGVAVDSLGNIYVADSGNNAIRKIASGNITTLAGQAGVPGSADGLGTNALFDQPEGVAVDTLGNIYVADTLNNTIRQVTSAGVVTTLAGTAGNWGSGDGANVQARFWGPQSLVASGNVSATLYVADTRNGTIRQMINPGTTWMVSTLAGSASSGSADGPVGTARFSCPQGAASDHSGNLYVADTANNTIRRLASGLVSTYAGQAGNAGNANGDGTNALLSGAQSVAADSSGNLYVADSANNTIRLITSAGAVSTLAGQAGASGSADGTGTNALFYQPQGVTVDTLGNVYVADTGNGTIREITTGGIVSTLAGVAGSPGSADGTNTSAHFNWPVGLALDHSGNVYVGDCLNHTIRQMSPVGTNWVVSTLAGQAGVWGNADGTNGAAQFFLPRGLVVDGSGNVFVADAGNQTIRKLSPVGTDWVVTTVGGLPGLSGATDGVGSAALFNYPGGVTMDASSHLYVADSGNDAIRSDLAVIPSLQYSALPGQFVVIWPLASDGFELEVTSALGPVAAWTPVVNTPAVSGTNYVLTNATATTAFYRLHKR